MKRKLRSIGRRPEAPRALVVDCRPGFDGPYFQGEGDDETVCGRCDHTLIRGRLVAYLTLYLCCPSCGTYNLADGEDASPI